MRVGCPSSIVSVHECHHVSGHPVQHDMMFQLDMRDSLDPPLRCTDVMNAAFGATVSSSGLREGPARYRCWSPQKHGLSSHKHRQ